MAQEITAETADMQVSGQCMVAKKRQCGEFHRVFCAVSAEMETPNLPFLG